MRELKIFIYLFMCHEIFIYKQLKTFVKFLKNEYKSKIFKIYVIHCKNKIYI